MCQLNRFSSILSKLLYLLNMKFELYTTIKSYRYCQNFSDALYYVRGISTYKDIWVCVYVSVHITWIDLDKWIFVKTFQVSILASLSLIVVSIKCIQWICFTFHYIVIITQENCICIKPSLYLKMAIFLKNVLNRKYAKLKINEMTKCFL